MSGSGGDHGDSDDRANDDHTERIPSADNRDGDAPTEQFKPTGPADPPTQQLPPADPPTQNLPPVSAGSGPTAAWSEYPDESPPGSWPGEHYPANADHEPAGGAAPPGDVPPPVDHGGDDGDGGDGWDHGRGGSTTPWMIVAALIAFALVAGLIAWLVAVGDGSGNNTATPTTSSTTSSATSTKRTPSSSPTPTSSAVPGVSERCSAEYVRDRVDSDATVRDCDGRFLLVSIDEGDLALFTWRNDEWSFLAEPSSDVCREQLEEIGVPNNFRRVFQPCAAPTTSATSKSSTSKPTSTKSTTTKSKPSSSKSSSASSSPPTTPTESSTSETDTEDAGEP